MTFGKALKKLKKGWKVARGGWNGKGMWTMKIWCLSARLATRLTPVIWAVGTGSDGIKKVLYQEKQVLEILANTRRS